MKKLFPIALTVILFSNSPAADEDPRILESRAITQEFKDALKSEMQSALKLGGPGKAIEVCSVRAPMIAHKLSQQTGWHVARTSLKPRNRSNAPDGWEFKVLKSFEQRRAKGESPQDIEFAEETMKGGEKVFRYMKAIGTAPVCLTCHGENIAPELATQLDTYYPQDKARGFKKGDIRGAFTLTHPL